MEHWVRIPTLVYNRVTTRKPHGILPCASTLHCSMHFGYNLIFTTNL